MNKAILAAVLMAIATGLILLNYPQAEDEIWRDIQQRGTLVFAVDATFPPFSALDGNGNYGGFDVEFARLLAAEMNLAPHFRLVSFDSLLGSTVVRQADIAVSALVPQPARTEDVFFSTPYFNAGTRLVSPNTVIERPIVEWVEGKTIVVELGSQGDVLVRRWEQTMPALDVIRVTSNAEVEAALNAETADVGLADVVAAFAMTESNLDWDGTHVETVPYVMASSRQAPVLHQEIEAAIMRLEESGKLPALRAKWFGLEASTLSFAP